MCLHHFEYIQIRGITPDTPAHALGLTVRQSGHGVDGIIDKPLRPGASHTKDEAEAKKAALFLEGTRKWLRSKSRRHHNNKGYRRIKNDQCYKEVKAIGERFFSG
uniref:Uncharacterized protein n=1 Tax=viral metagenome TaxID=1070528 RepID=A0A6M3XN67_9ZZZZ